MLQGSGAVPIRAKLDPSKHTRIFHRKIDSNRSRRNRDVRAPAQTLCGRLALAVEFDARECSRAAKLGLGIDILTHDAPPDPAAHRGRTWRGR